MRAPAATPIRVVLLRVMSTSSAHVPLNSMRKAGDSSSSATLIFPLFAQSTTMIFSFAVMAPALIMQAMLVAKNSRPEHSTEAFTWSSTGLLAGVGLGLMLGGALLEVAKSPAVFTAAAALSVAAGLLALLLKLKS